MSGYNKRTMVHWKNLLFAKSIIFLSLLIALSFFSCDKTSKDTEENTPPPNQQDSSLVAVNNEERAKPANPPKESEPKPVPVPESVVPESVRRPQQGEAPRFPSDIIIGTLGQGEASGESYRFAWNILQTLLHEESWSSAGQNASESVLSDLPQNESERITRIFSDINPKDVRIGGGRIEADGSVSFLVRFIGETRWSGGEIFIRQHENVWNAESIILDEPGEEGETRGQYRFNFPPYERLF
jgi:hypothetical protein